MRSAILLVSLFANVALGVWLVARPRTVEPVSPAPLSAPAPVESTSAQKSFSAQKTSPADVPAPLLDPAPAFHWSQLESSDYKEYIGRLRAFGVPEKTVRDIIFADVAKLYRPRLLALQPPPSTRTNFWEEYASYNRPQRTREQREQYRALQKEKSDLLKTLLGENVQDERVVDAGGKAWFEREFDMVPAEHRDKVREMRERYQEVTSEIYERAGGYHDLGIQAELRAARNKLYGELAMVLTPQQLEDYKLRSSDIASNMRYELSKFEPNEEEFRSIHRYKEAMEAARTDRDSDFDPPPPSSEEAKVRRQKQKEAEDALAAALGPERAKELKLMEQYDYRNLLESGASKESVFRVAEMRDEVEAAARKIRQDKTLSEEDRKAALAVMRAETEKELKDLLGDRRARGFTANNGYWIRNLSPRD
jgi:hypothetical protein